ncbi:hybrid sensor histidine kinase/response regulator, partial [Bacteroidales bacterium OttesenSCG-928-L03]|nr:hybrid sensor histidine kinase/response regulator [Bacteroidales bacterium OttesenSCG-928-L03]
MKSKLLTIILFLAGVFSLSAQPPCYLEHYSTEDGLPQFTIMDMLQDHKGFMWLATWDGFSKFDGHTFRNYKVQPGDDYYMRSNRIERIVEDRYGNLWLESYDKEAHCFNPRTETFNGIYSTPGLEDNNFRLSRIKVQPSGSVWLLSETNGCIHIVDSLFTVKEFSQEKGLLKGNHIYDVFEDAAGNNWILTDNGLVKTNNDHTEIVPLFFENAKGATRQPFFAAIEQNGEIWFGSSKGRIWRYNKATQKFSFYELQTPSSIDDFRKIDDRHFIITTVDQGFFVCDLDTEEMVHYHRGNTPALKSDRISGLFLDSDQRFWFRTDELGIYKFDTRTRQVKFFFVETDDHAMTVSPAVAKVIEDAHGYIWVHPRGGGLSFYDQEKDTLLPFFNKKSEANWKFSNILHCMFSDKQGNLWFSTHSHGLEKATFEDNYFTAQRVNKTSNTVYSNNIRAVFQDADNRIWIATKDRRLALFDESMNYLGSLSPEGTLQREALFTGQVYSLMQDDRGSIWAGTKGDGLFRITKTDSDKRYQLKQFRRSETDIYSISDDIIYSVYQDSKKNIWVGTYGNGLNLMRETPEGKIQFINHRNMLKDYPIETGYRIRFVTENKYGNICVGTTAGLIMFSSTFSSPDEIEYRHYSRVPGDVESLGSNDVHGICSTQGGDLFLVTFGGGLNKVAEFDEQGFPTRFKVYGSREGLPSEICLAVVEDENNKLWVSMENNLTKFDPEKEIFETFVEVRRLMSTHNFSEASACRLSNGDMLFGYSNGVLTFSPERITKNGFVPYIALSDFKIFNRPVVIGGADSPLQETIDDVKKVVLKRNQNFFSVEFSALDFILSNDILYAYKLEGFDNDWIYSQKQRVANYTNIPRGDYLLRVKST